MRRGEALALRWTDVDFTRSTIFIARSMNGSGQLGPTKTRKSRPISIDAATVELLRGLSREGDLIFDITPHALTREFIRTIERAGVPRIRLHDLRHMHATTLLRAGVPVLVVSKRLGHSKVSITMDVYAHVLPSDDQDAAEVMGSAFA